MRRNYGVFVAMIVVMGAIVGNARGAEWMDDYAQALEAARKENQPLLVLFENPAQETFEISTVSASKEEKQDNVFDSVQLCRIDTTTKMGKLVAEAFGVESVPYMVITDKQTRRIVYRKSGEIAQVDFDAALVKYVADHEPVAAPASASSSRRFRCFS